MEATPRPCANWTPDCQGKWDYDGRLISISCRYWPRGGGFTLFRDGVEQPQNNEIKPSAVASISIDYGPPDEDGYGDSVDIWEAKFEGENETEVKSQVESWVEERFGKVVDAINNYDRLRQVEKLAGELAEMVVHQEITFNQNPAYFDGVDINAGLRGWDDIVQKARSLKAELEGK